MRQSKELGAGRRAGIVLALAALAMAATPAQTAQNSGTAMDPGMLPSGAKPGECYARVWVPPQYATTSERVLKREAAEKLEVVPARYEWVTEQVLVKEASEKLEIVPATWEWVEERVLVTPASSRVEVVPAQYRTESEQVLETPARTEWKKGEGPMQRMDNTTGEIMCLVEIPATYRTVTRTVLASPATTREVEIPAEYKTVRKHVLKAPPSTRTVTIPAEYKTVKVRRLVAEPTVRRIEIPAEYQQVSKTAKVRDGHMEWKQVLCKTNATPGTITSLQRALKDRSLYAGPIDGIVGPMTVAAVESFQRDAGLARGGLTLETLQALNLRMR